MSTPQKMSKIRIVTPKSQSSTVIDTLYNLTLFHVKKYKQGQLENLDSGTPLSSAEAVSKALLSVRSIKAQLNIDNKNNEGKKHSDTNIKRAMERIQSLKQKTSELKREQKETEERLVTVQQMQSVLKALHACDVELELLPKLRHVSTFIGMITDDKTFKEKVKELKSYELKTSPFNGGHIAVLFVQNKDHGSAKQLIIEAGFTPLDLAVYRTTSREQLEREHKGLSEKINAIKTKHKEIKKNSTSFLCDSEHALEEEIKKVELPLQFATTKQSLIATGFVPTKRLAHLKNKLVDATNNNVFIEDKKVDHYEKIPVKLHNGKTVRNFEVLQRLYELPSYFEVDPSLLIFLTFPLFFGMMLGDVGYGLITLLLFMFLKKKFPKAKSWFNVLMFASVITILFGFAFGEAFGFEHLSMETGQALCEKTGICLHKEIIEHHGTSEVVYAFPRLMNRVHDTINVGGFELLSILAIGIAIGFLHLNFGLLIGFYNIWKAHGIKMAVLEKFSWFVMQAGLALTLLSITNTISLSKWIGIALFALAVVMLYLGEGPKGVIEIPALFSNMLSYMRLGAVGLASVGLAVVVNENLALPLIEKGGFNIVIAAIVMVLGHTINIALGVIGPFLHGIRLHYVEFFSKFFHGGGKEYTPFGKKAQMGGE
jgi:V/A-type H+/Na+-transporting ATPase subunit I